MKYHHLQKVKEKMKELKKLNMMMNMSDMSSSNFVEF